MKAELDESRVRRRPRRKNRRRKRGRKRRRRRRRKGRRQGCITIRGFTVEEVDGNIGRWWWGFIGIGGEDSSAVGRVLR